MRATFWNHEARHRGVQEPGCRQDSDDELSAAAWASQSSYISESSLRASDSAQSRRRGRRPIRQQMSPDGPTRIRELVPVWAYYVKSCSQAALLLTSFSPTCVDQRLELSVPTPFAITPAKSVDMQATRHGAARRYNRRTGSALIGPSILVVAFEDS